MLIRMAVLRLKLCDEGKQGIEEDGGGWMLGLS